MMPSWEHYQKAVDAKAAYCKDKNEMGQSGVLSELNNTITNPLHYNSTGIEVINVIETYATQYPKEIIPHMSNVFKYSCRAPYKGALLEDLKKARAYLTRAITTLEGEPRWE